MGLCYSSHERMPTALNLSLTLADISKQDIGRARKGLVNGDFSLHCNSKIAVRHKIELTTGANSC